MLQSIKLYMKYIGCFLICLFSLQAMAQSRLQNTVSRRVAEQQSQQQNASLLAYREQLAGLATPDSKLLLPVLRNLIVYNQIFEKPQFDKNSRELADLLNAPVKVAWNASKGDRLVEIFDKYVPDSHGDEALAALEFYIKVNIISEREARETKQLLAELPQPFVSSYHLFSNGLRRLNKNDPAKVIALLAALAKQYNLLYEQNPQLALQLHNAFFKYPIRTGWFKTVTVEDLLVNYAGLSRLGPGWNYSAGTLVLLYECSAQEAKAVTEWVKHYYL